MSDSKPAGPQSANTASGGTAKIIPKPGEENISQNPLNANAPPRCEMCDADVPDVATRTAHMAQTKHCACSECKAYVPPGMLYSHCWTAHANLTWNDHAVAWTDKVNVRNAMPWAREAWEKAVGRTVDGVPIANK
jgi:hypothetical protein